jgi:membrane-associated phospholipid phosphatase
MIVLITSMVATLVSLGRLALGVHYPSDVIAGAGLGFIATATVIFFLTFQP